jgi:hypothetical protein
VVHSELRKSKNFQAVFLDSLESARQKAAVTIDSAEDLFFTSAFSVRRERLPQLKQELRDLMLGFVDRHEHVDGCKVTTLTVALW